MKQEYTLAKLQAAYLEVTLRKEKSNGQDVCMFCWQSQGCGCGTNDSSTEELSTYWLQAN
ncbi:hypothetical protein WKH57_01295 [Niallia taxi]|uniref:hypothetical protein n=1 Tax=Niallia taxi TaxID=2499688 RepID=UPI00317FE242